MRIFRDPSAAARAAARAGDRAFDTMARPDATEADKRRASRDARDLFNLANAEGAGDADIYNARPRG